MRRFQPTSMGKCSRMQHGEASRLPGRWSRRRSRSGGARGVRRASMSLGSSSVRSSSKGRRIAKEAGFVDGHGLGDGALEGGIFAGAEVADEFVEMAHALVAQQLGEAGIEEVVARGIEDILREAEDELAQIAIVDGGGIVPSGHRLRRECAARELARGRGRRCEGFQERWRRGGGLCARGRPWRRRRACPRRCWWARPGRGRCRPARG